MGWAIADAGPGLSSHVAIARARSRVEPSTQSGQPAAAGLAPSAASPPAPPGSSSRGRGPRPWWQRLAVWLAVAAGAWLLLCGLAALAVPLVLDRFVLPRASETIGRELTAERLRFNPFTLVLDATGLRVAAPDGSARDFITVQSLHADLSIASLRHLAPVVEALRVQAPQVHVVRTGAAQFDFDDIVARLQARPADAQPGSDEPARFALHRLEVVDGLVRVEDRHLGQRHQVTELALAVPLASTLDPQAQDPVEPRLTAKLNGSPIVITGRSLPFGETKETALELSVESLDIGTYLRLSPAPLGFTVPSGRLGMRLAIDFARAGGDDLLGISGAAQVEDLRVDAAGGSTLVRVRRIDAQLERLEPLASRYLIGDLRLQSPDVTIERRADGSLPIVQAFTPGAPARRPAAASSGAGARDAAAPAQAGEPPHWSVRRLRVEDGRVGYGDATVSPAVSLRQSSIAIDVGEIGNRQARPAPASLSFVQGEASRLDWKGELDLARSRLAGRLQAKVAEIAPYAPWLADALAASLTTGEIGLEGRLSLDWSGDFALEATQTSASVVDAKLRLADAEAPAVSLRRLAARDATFSLGSRRLAIGEVTLAGAEVDLLREADGSLNLARLAPDAADRDRAGPADVNADSRAEDDADREPQDRAGGATPAWSVQVERLVLEDNAVRFRDLGAARPVDIPVSQIAGSIDKLGTDLSAESPLDLRARIGPAGMLAVRGTAVAAPLSARLSLDLQRFALPLVDPYVAAFLTLGLDEGSAGTRGELELAGERLRYRGRLQVDGLRSRERTTATDTLRWGRLLVDGIDIDVDPAQMGPGDKVNLGTVTLSDFFARILLTEDGRFNLQDIFVTEASEQARRRARERSEAARSAPAPAPAEADEGKLQASTEREAAPGAGAPADRAASPGPGIRLGGLVLERGRTNFTDRFIRPNYTVNLTDLQGNLSAMATDGQAPADVVLRGRIDGDAPVDISGKIDPLAHNLFLDVQAQAKGIDLPTLSPYSVKYVGYAIEKGQLSVDVRYRVENEQLEAQNRIFLDQLTLGDKIDSPDAIDLPIQFALGLLKNSRGEIDLNLPISGSLDDPQFSIGGVIAKAFTNLLGRIVTAPFSALAAAFGGSGASGEELSYVEFSPGTADLVEASVKRLGTLAKALAERPALKLEVAGRVDPAAERDAIRRERLDQQLRALKRREVRQPEANAAAPAQSGGGQEARETRPATRVTVTREERPALVQKLYHSLVAQEAGEESAAGSGKEPAESADKEPAPGTSAVATPDVAEMERRLLEAIEVDAESVRRLANRRADAVRSWLASQGKIDRERIFLLAPRTSPSAVGPNRSEPQCPARCAEFSLR